MNNEKTEAENTLINKFMGLSNEYYSEFKQQMLPVDLIWGNRSPVEYPMKMDWLAPVAKKIFSNEFRDQCKSKGLDLWLEVEPELMDNIIENAFNPVGLHKAVVTFIEWYNACLINPANVSSVSVLGKAD